MITVYTKDHCPNCVKVKNVLNAAGITYAETPITEDIVTWAKSNGITAAPIVRSDYPEFDHGGFNPEVLAKLVNKVM